MAPYISLATIVKDEARLITPMLESAKQLCGELIVVDTGSTDNTVELARAAGATVIEIPWPDSFAAARNVALEAATGTWILQLDGDEVLMLPRGEPHARFVESELRKLEKLPEFPHCVMQIPMEDRTLEGVTTAEYVQARLYPNHPLLRFVGRVHNRLQFTSGRFAEVAPILGDDAKILHFGYDESIYAQKDKSERLFGLLALEESDLRAQGKEPDALHLFYLGRELGRLERYAESAEYLRRAIPGMVEHAAMRATSLSAYCLLLTSIANTPTPTYHLSSVAADVASVFAEGQRLWGDSPDLWAAAGRAFGTIRAYRAAMQCFAGAEHRLQLPYSGQYTEIRHRVWEIYENGGRVLAAWSADADDVAIARAAQEWFQRAVEAGTPYSEQLLPLIQAAIGPEEPAEVGPDMPNPRDLSDSAPETCEVGHTPVLEPSAPDSPQEA